MEQLNNNVIGEFFEKLGILEENDRDEFFKKIDENHKVNLTQDLDLAVALRKDKGNGKIYTVKNKDLETTMDFAVYYYDLYRQFFAWFIDFKNSHDKNLDGKKILDLGCDNGITTCFVANLYPNSEIIGVDKCKKGIKCAEEIAKKLGVKNVKFEAVDAKKVDKFFKEEKFDLVISNRSILEITNLPKLKSFWSIDEVENSIVVANSVLKFFKSVEKVMTNDAKLITFERLDGLEEILNFIKSMHASGLYVDIDSMCKIQFNELNDVEQMPLIVFDKTERDEIGFYDAIEIYNKLPILNKQKDIEDEFAIELQFEGLGEKELVYGTQIDYKTGVGSERREVWEIGDKYVTYKYSNVGRRELVTEGIEKDKAINEIRAMSNFIGRIGHKVTEYHSIEEREKLVK